MTDPWKRILAIGDIHGCDTALRTLIEYVPIGADDLVVTLGDYVDRGPGTREVVQWLIQRFETGALIPLRGNHEVMMLAAMDGTLSLRSWLRFGGDKVFESYSGGASGSFRDIPAEHIRFVREQLLPYYETSTHIFVHAAADSALPMRAQSEDVLFWERFDAIQQHDSGKTIVCGHTSQRTGLPNDRGHAVCIDTWVYGDGWLTCLDVITGQFWQANQQGRTRKGLLSDLR